MISRYDYAVFMWHENGQLVGVIVLHVDDFIYCDTLLWHDVMMQITTVFKISKHEEGTFKYIGINIEQKRNAILIDQRQYVNDIQEIEISNDRKSESHSPLTKKEKDILRSMCGKLLWVSSQSRPGIAYHTCQLSNAG